MVLQEVHAAYHGWPAGGFLQHCVSCNPLGDEERRKMTCMKRSDSDRLLGSQNASLH